MTGGQLERETDPVNRLASALLLATPLLASPGFTNIGLAQTLSYIQPLTPAATRDVQDHLRQMGAYDGPIDGVWGARSRIALERFQRTHELQVTGEMNPATAATLGLNTTDLLAAGQAPAPAAAAPQTSALSPEVVRNVQTRLRTLGFYSGAIDGIWGPNMQAAIEHFQQGRGLQANGQLTPATITAMGLDPNNLSAPAR